MSDNQTQDNLDTPQSNSMAAFSDKMEDLGEALDVLYIPRNASGRNKFRGVWPDIALYLFGEKLIEYDDKGGVDHDHRRELEETACDKRLLLKSVLKEIVNKSVDAGMLDMEYVGKVIDEFGSCVSKFLYAENIIERVRPGLLVKTQDEKDNAVQKEQDKQDQKDDAVRTMSSSDVAVDNSPKESTQSVSSAVEEPVEDLERQRVAEEKSILSNVTEVKDEAEASVEPSKPKLEIPGMPPIADDMFDDVMPIDTSAPAQEVEDSSDSSPEVVEDAQDDTENIVEEKADILASIAPEAGDNTVSSDTDPASLAASLLGGDVKVEPAAEEQKGEENAVDTEASNPAPSVFGAAEKDVNSAPSEIPSEAEEDAQSAEAAEEDSKPAKGVYKTMFNALAQAA